MPLKLVKEPKSPFWYVSGTVGGRRIRKSTQTASKRIAEGLRKRWETELDERRAFGEHAGKTFAHAVNLYLDHDGSPRFLTPIVERIGGMPLDHIDQNTMDDLHRELYPAAKPSTVNRQLYVPVVAVMTKAAKRKWCHVPMFDRPKGYNARKERVNWLTPETVEVLLDHAALHAKAILIAGVGAGFREEDLLTFKWEDVSLRSGQAVMDIGKQGITRTYGLQPRVIHALSGLPSRSGVVLVNQWGDPYSTGPGRSLNPLWKRLCARAGVERFTSHDLRHTWATWHYAMFKDKLRLQLEGQWASSEMVERYAHQAPDDLRERLLSHGWTMKKTVGLLTDSAANGT